MADIDWTQPATVYSRIPLAGGPPRERAQAITGNLEQAVRFAMTGSSGPLDRLVVKIDDGSAEYEAEQIRALARQLP